MKENKLTSYTFKELWDIVLGTELYITQILDKYNIPDNDQQKIIDKVAYTQIYVTDMLKEIYPKLNEERVIELKREITKLKQQEAIYKIAIVLLKHEKAEGKINIINKTKTNHHTLSKIEDGIKVNVECYYNVLKGLGYNRYEIREMLRGIEDE